MNIHFDNIELFNCLKDNSLYSTVIGSQMYKITDHESDKDILHILPNPLFFDSNPFLNVHQYQFKENGIDHIFTTLNNFIRNIITGDATINFEVLNNIDDESILYFLYENRFMFYTYNIMKSYLGFINRDIKYFDRCTTERSKTKKLIHIYRSFKFFNMIYSGLEFNVDLSTDPIINEIKQLTNYSDFLIKYKQLSELYRKELNDKLNNNQLTSFMKVDDQIEIQNWLLALYECTFYKEKQLNLNKYKLEIESIVYSANENGIKY